jgi:hypothetical protein
MYYTMMTRNGALVIPMNNVITVVLWDTVRFAQGSSIPFNTSTSRFTIPATGLWTIECMFHWDTVNTWSRSLLRIEHNTQGSVLMLNQSKPNNLPSGIQLVGTIALTSGDEIWATIEQSHATQNQSVMTGVRTFISLRFNG